ncbi:MAG: DUF2799 domain-containing protein [Maricaulaceae bacterium]|jgi:hypothetical protein
MRILAVLFFSLVAAAAVSGCASMSENECRVADWHALGYEDGAAGRPAGYVGERRQACARHQVGIDFDSYLEGRDRGLVQFCRPERGFNIGAQGGGYAGVCPAELEGPFLAEYEVGRRLNTLSRAAHEASADLERAHLRLENLNSRIVDAEVAVVFEDLSIEERASLLVQINAMMEQRTGLRESIPHLERAQAAAIAELERYEAWLDGPRSARVAYAGE